MHVEQSTIKLANSNEHKVRSLGDQMLGSPSLPLCFQNSETRLLNQANLLVLFAQSKNKSSIVLRKIHNEVAGSTRTCALHILTYKRHSRFEVGFRGKVSIFRGEESCIGFILGGHFNSKCMQHTTL